MIIWRGPSRIDGAPIAAIATIDSANRKTAGMVQIWIIRTDVSPTETRYTGQDRSVCGDCPRRHYLGGDCYVHLYQAPRAVFDRYHRGGYECPKHIAKVTRALREDPIRLGAYGDPCAVPFHVWESLIAQGCGRWSGYTHQWHMAGNQEYRKVTMASCDTEDEARIARGLGWGFFLVTYGEISEIMMTRTVECLATSQDKTCEECAICDGTRADSIMGRASVVIQAHGARSLPKLRVLK